MIRTCDKCGESFVVPVDGRGQDLDFITRCFVCGIITELKAIKAEMEAEKHGKV